MVRPLIAKQIVDTPGSIGFTEPIRLGLEIAGVSPASAKALEVAWIEAQADTAVLIDSNSRVNMAAISVILDKMFERVRKLKRPFSDPNLDDHQCVALNAVCYFMRSWMRLAVIGCRPLEYTQYDTITSASYIDEAAAQFLAKGTDRIITLLDDTIGTPLDSPDDSIIRAFQIRALCEFANAI